MRVLVLVTDIILLEVSLELLCYYWNGKVVLTTSGYFEILLKARCGKSKRNKFMKLVEYIFFATWKKQLGNFTNKILTVYAIVTEDILVLCCYRIWSRRWELKRGFLLSVVNRLKKAEVRFCSASNVKISEELCWRLSFYFFENWTRHQPSELSLLKTFFCRAARRRTSKFDFQISELSNWKLKFEAPVFIPRPMWSIFTPVDTLTNFWLILSI